MARRAGPARAALIALALAACKITSGTPGTEPDVGQRYTCSIERSCLTQRATIASSWCAVQRAEAEDRAVAAAGCEACVCFVGCERDSPPRPCLLEVDAGQ